MSFKNNVTRFLDSRKVTYTVHEYDYEAGVHSATEVAHAIGLPAERVFKTLVVVSDEAGAKPVLAIVPGPATLDLKALAQAVDARKLRMASHEQAEKLTGLQTGGISPLALINRGFRIYLDEHARSYPTIAVSAGLRGANVELAVDDLVRLTGARVVRL